jgi:hypothetical protein
LILELVPQVVQATALQTKRLVMDAGLAHLKGRTKRRVGDNFPDSR